MWISIYYDQLNSISLTIASLTLSVATDAVTTMMIGYKLWYVTSEIQRIQRINMNQYCRSYRRSIMKTLSLSGRKSPVQNILILLVESGVVYLGFQVSDVYISLADMCAQDP